VRTNQFSESALLVLVGVVDTNEQRLLLRWSSKALRLGVPRPHLGETGLQIRPRSDDISRGGGFKGTEATTAAPILLKIRKNIARGVVGMVKWGNRPSSRF